MKKTAIPRSITAIIIFLAVLGCAFDTAARRQRTTRQGLKERIQFGHATGDTLALTSDSVIIFSGYDKTLRSHSETVFAFNNSTDTITSMLLSVTYTDIHDRQLHTRRVTVRQTIPPGERRMLTYSSWDRQNSYYYYRSEPGRVRYQAVTPYKVNISTIRAYIAKRQTSGTSGAPDNAAADSTAQPSKRHSRQ